MRSDNTPSNPTVQHPMRAMRKLYVATATSAVVIGVLASPVTALAMHARHSH